MKYGKIIGILLFICIAITFLGMVSASDVVVNGEKFHIPDDFEKDNESSDVEKTSVGLSETVMYGNGIDFVTLSIDSFNSGVPDLPSNSNYTDKKIKGIEGKYRVDEYGNEEFIYINNDKLIYISITPDSSVSFEDIILQSSPKNDSGSSFNIFG